MRRLGTLRNRKQTLKVIQELDAFPKVPENCQETTVSGGSVSILSFVFIALLVVSEFWYYRGVETKYKYEVDTDSESKLRINIDMTVAMKCDEIGADVLDLSGTTVDLGDQIKLEPSYFELTEEQKLWLMVFRKFHGMTEGYRALKDMAMFAASDIPTYMPPRKNKDKESTPPDACRIHGSFEVNKVAGNFHITAGKSVYHPRGHAHLSAMVSQEVYNFSHRIDQLSFGSHVPGYVYPLDGDMMVAQKKLYMYQYYIQVVPTSVKKLNGQEIKTNQYSVTQREREINHDAGSHGVSGVFFKYDLSSIMVRVSQQHRSFWQFIVRLCGIVGGIFATSGMLHDFVGFVFDTATCKWKKKTNPKGESSNAPAVSPGPSSSLLANGVPQDGYQNTPSSPGTPTTPITPSPDQSTTYDLSASNAGQDNSYINS